MTSALVRTSRWSVSKVFYARADAATSPFFRARRCSVSRWLRIRPVFTSHCLRETIDVGQGYSCSGPPDIYFPSLPGSPVVPGCPSRPSLPLSTSVAEQEESLSGASRLLRGPAPEGGEGGVEGRQWVKGGWDRVKVRRGGEESHNGPSG